MNSEDPAATKRAREWSRIAYKYKGKFLEQVNMEGKKLVSVAYNEEPFKFVYLLGEEIESVAYKTESVKFVYVFGNVQIVNSIKLKKFLE